MPRLNWKQRFFESTRGRIIMLLRRASRTVEEVAQELDLTDNAVRAHLTTLERDGLGSAVPVVALVNLPSCTN